MDLSIINSTNIISNKQQNNISINSPRQLELIAFWKSQITEIVAPSEDFMVKYKNKLLLQESIKKKVNIIPKEQQKNFLDPSCSLDLLFKERKIEFHRFYSEACQLGNSRLKFVTGPNGKFYVHLFTELDHAQLYRFSKGNSEDLLSGIPYGLTIHNIVQKKGQAFDWNHGLKDAICTHFILEDPGNSIYEKLIDPSSAHMVAARVLTKLEVWLKTHKHIPRLESGSNSTIFFNPTNQKVSILARRCWWNPDLNVHKNLEAINEVLLNIFSLAPNTKPALDESLKTAKQAVDHYTINSNGLFSLPWAAEKILTDYIQLLKATIRDYRLARIRREVLLLGLPERADLL